MKKIDQIMSDLMADPPGAGDELESERAQVIRARLLEEGVLVFPSLVEHRADIQDDGKWAAHVKVELDLVAREDGSHRTVRWTATEDAYLGYVAYLNAYAFAVDCALGALFPVPRFEQEEE